jgi:hypothetical protein
MLFMTCGLCGFEREKVLLRVRIFFFFFFFFFFFQHRYHMISLDPGTNPPRKKKGFCFTYVEADSIPPMPLCICFFVFPTGCRLARAVALFFFVWVVLFSLYYFFFF